MGFGTTFRLDGDGQLVFSASTQRLELVSGPDALVQDVKHRLLTVAGEDPIHPLVGLPIVDLFSRHYDETAWVNAIRDQVRADPRIQSIDNVAIERQGPRSVAVTVEGTAVDGTTFKTTTLVGRTT